MGKSRLDQLLVDRGLAGDLPEARALTLAGRVYSASGRRLDKPGHEVDEAIQLEVRRGRGPRGAEKLRGALDYFGLDPTGRTAADIGASTGGFTSVLLERGAARVYAIDVGEHQLLSKLVADPRVVVMDSVNARYLEELPEPIGLFTIDVSFISLTKILPAVRTITRTQGKAAEVLALVKPQFEVGREVASKFKGVIADPQLQREAVERVKQEARSLGFTIRGEVPSSLRGPKGNQEYFLWLEG